MDLATKIEKTAFLTYEFLAWLAARVQLDLGLLGEEKDASMELWFEKRLVLAERDSPSEQTVIRSDEPLESFETKTALRLGKWIREASVAIVHDKMEWHLRVSAPDLALKAVVVKSGAEFQKGDDGLILDRVAGLEDLLALWHRIYQYFLTLRLDEDRWAGERARIERWILA